MPIAGFNASVTVATGRAATYVEMDGIKDFKIGDSRDLLDVSAFNDPTAVHARLAALRDVKLDISGDFEPADTAYTRLLGSYEAGETLCVKLYTSAVAPTSGFGYMLKIASLDISGAVDGKIDASFSLMADSAATTAIFTLAQ